MKEVAIQESEEEKARRLKMERLEREANEQVITLFGLLQLIKILIVFVISIYISFYLFVTIFIYLSMYDIRKS